MKLSCPLGVLALAAAAGCGKDAARMSPPTAELTRIVERQTIHLQDACRDRDEQNRVIDELEKLDRAAPAAERAKAEREIAQLEEFRRRLDKAVEQQAQLVEEAKKMLAEAHK
jgi:hypothetical protein